MNKQQLIPLMICIPFCQMSVQAISFNVFKKRETELVKEENIQVPAKSQIILSNIRGSYTIKPWDQKKISLEALKTGTAEQVTSTTIKSKVSGKEVTISTTASESESAATVEYTLRVPDDASVKIVQTHGPVTINGIEGDIDISLEEGHIDIKGSTKMVIAKTGKGNITVRQRKLTDLNSIFLQAHKGNITLFLPRETRATLHANVGRGVISSDHPVTMTLTTKLDKTCWDRLKKEVNGILGTFKDSDELVQMQASAPITLEATVGNIHIQES